MRTNAHLILYISNRKIKTYKFAVKLKYFQLDFFLVIT